MSDEQISSGADFETAARQLARRLDADRDGALAEFRDMLARKGMAGKVLQQLNRLDRHDAVLAFAGLVPDAKVNDHALTEIARAFAQSGNAARAEEILTRASASRRTDYNFQLAAGRVLAEVRMHRQALIHFEAAWASKPTQAVAERALLSQLALEQYRDAATVMFRIVRAGSYPEDLAPDFAYLLRHIERGTLDADLAFALSSVQNSGDEVGSALMPHLIAREMMDFVLAVVDRDLSSLGIWSEASLLELVAYLAKHRKIDHLLRVHDHYDGGSAAVSASIAGILGGMPVAQMTQFMSPGMDGFMKPGADAKAYREIASRFAETAGAEDGLSMLRLVPSVIARDDAAKFLAREKSRLSRLASHVLAKLDRRADAAEALVAVTLHFVEPRIAEFFAGPGLRELAATLALARRQCEAPDGSRLARLREDYFSFHLERRTGKGPDALVNDIQFCEAVFDYFHALAQVRPAVTVPAGSALVARTGRKALALEDGRTLDVLTNWGLLQARPMFSLVPPGQYDRFHAWYIDTFFGVRRMSPDCLNASLVAYFNEPVLNDPLTGLCGTRYLRLLARSGDYRKAFDVANLIDRHLLVLTLIVDVLAGGTQFFPFFKPLLVGAHTAPLGKLIAALGGAALLDAVDGTAMERPAARAEGGPQDVLLIGHASKETGLGRNFGMLAKGLAGDGIALKGLDFDAGADAFNDELANWHDGLKSRPIAVFAVNAHDVPDIFVKDRNALLADCYTAGFYLWEVSRIPRLQELGVALVDEVWAPTRYVADIYAPLKQTHVVGKGLFAGDEPFLARPKPVGANARFTFVTVFDFDSSIERKNPLAVVLAFQKAFGAGEKADLIVKTSNVNPRHWSNVWGQWERLTAASAGDKRIKIVTTRYSNDEMTALVRDADCIVSLHRSEGFGYLMADAMAFGTPVIATDYSGNADFCTSETSYPVAYGLAAVPPGAVRWRCDDAQWAAPDIDAAAAQMRAVYGNYDAALARAARARENIKSQYAISAFKAALSGRVRAIAATL